MPLSALVFSLAVAAASDPGTLFDASGIPLRPGELARRARDADLVLVGESHASACDHHAQAIILEQLASAGLEPVLGLEMVAVDQQRGLDLFNERRFGFEAVGSAVDWEFYWGIPYALYAPIFEVAERHGVPVRALNIPRRALTIIVDRGVPPEELRPRWQVPPVVLPPPAEQLPSLRAEYDAHRQFLPDRVPASFERFELAQSLWDSMMASEALQAVRDFGRRVVVLAGAGHVEHGWGIASRVRRLAPEARILSIAPWRGGPQPGRETADLFFLCPAPELPSAR